MKKYKDVPCNHEKLEYRPCCDAVICLKCQKKWEKLWVTVTASSSNTPDWSKNAQAFNT
jgi:hypothetical protein